VRSAQYALMLIVFLLALASCTQSAPQAPQVSPFLPKASIREIMDAEVDPAADVLWDAVATNITLAGRDDRQPRTPEEWQAVRRSAIMLLEATNLLVMEGRRIAPPDTPLTPGELNPTVLQQRLDSNRAPFVGFAQALRNVSLKALDAIDAKDATRLFEAGGEIDEACEACHLVYWYPPDAAPKN
jgi:hypothetical protein